MKIEVDTRAKGVESAYVAGPFDQSKAALEEAGYDPISVKLNARLRIQKGRDADISKYGNRAREGFEYFAGKPVLLRMNSRLLDSKLAEKAVQANRAGHYFSLGSEVYAQDYELMNKEASKEPEKRSVLILPKRDNFSITPTDEVAIALFGGEKAAKRYFEFAGRDSIDVYLIDKKTVDAQDQTLLTQLWFRYLGIDSDLDCSNRGLNGGSGGYGLRGVRKCAEGAKQTGEAGSPKIKAPNLQEILKFSKSYVPSVARAQFAKGLKELYSR